MANRITPGQIKKTNRQQIYDHIYRKKRVSQQDIIYALGLSRPTVAANLAELEMDGLIHKSGQMPSEQIGRKAAAYSITPDARVAVGVEIMSDQAVVIPVDLYGEPLDRRTLRLSYRNEEAYYEAVSQEVLAVVDGLGGVPPEHVLGVGFAMQGIVSADGTAVVYGAILGCTGLEIKALSRFLPYPCSFVHDPDGAALSELWCSPELSDAIYLSLSRHLGGSMINRRRIMTGKHGHTATFEHIRMRSGGIPCYCGGQGCAETLCSMNALLEGEEVEHFFANLRAGAPEHTHRWQAYLKNLSTLICNLHLIQDADFILGGHLAPYITYQDIQTLYDEIRLLCPFQEENDFLHVSKMPSHSITIGAALSYIQRFLEDISPAKL